MKALTKKMTSTSFEHQRILLKFVSRFNFGKVIPAPFDVVQADLVVEIISVGDFRLDLREVFYES